LTFRKYLVLAGVTVFSATGDSLLARGMKGLGNVSLRDLSSLVPAILNPWIAGGVLLLLAFFASYMAALSWADLTYVLPASSLGYVLVALIALLVFHEEISVTRWLGIAMISCGVGLVAAGPSVTPARKPRPSSTQETASQEAQS
jgi:drug/metabolite transporter (DMT)-like permease